MRLSRGFGRLGYSAFQMETLNAGGVVKASDWRTRGLAGRYSICSLFSERARSRVISGK